MKVSDISLKKKIGALTVVQIIAASVIAASLLMVFSSITGSMHEMAGYEEIKSSALRGNVAMLKAREYEAEFLIRHDEKWAVRVEKSITEVSQSLDRLDSINRNQKIKEHSATARKLAGQYIERFKKLADNARSTGFNQQAIADELEELRDVLNDFQPQLDLYIPKIAGELAIGASRGFESSIRQARVLILSVLMVAVLLQTTMLLTMMAPVLKSLSTMTERLRDIASGDGDLTRRLEVGGRDELGETAGWFNTFVEKLNSVVRQVAGRSGELGLQSASLSVTADQMSRGVEEVSARTAGLATAAEEMDATSRDIACNCQMAADNAAEVSRSASNGSEVLHSTIEVMRKMEDKVGNTAARIDALGERADQVGNIVTTIEDIADQTNLLALNAAIEAARAGESGRGFAVVADEVRALAGRTARATGEINVMIKGMQKETKDAVVAMKNSMADVSGAVDSAGRSGVVLDGIRERVEELSQQLNQIATAAEQQTATTQEITCSIQTASVTLDQTAVTVRDTSEAVHALDRVAEELNLLVAGFRLA